jgi:hypothetical protein
MTVRREIAELRRETDAQSLEDPMRTRAVRYGSQRRARRAKVRHMQRVSDYRRSAHELWGSLFHFGACVLHAVA